jgi:hypothetical protein
MMIDSRENQSAQREQALQLAEELAEVSLERGMNLREINGKMKQLMQPVTELCGNEVAQRVGEKGTVRFLAGELSNAYAGIRYSLTYSEDVEGSEKPEVIVFVDSDGGSMLMNKEEQAKNLGWKPGAGGVGEGDPFHKELDGWMVDDQYQRDLAVAESGQYDKYNASIGANRFRELRLAARLARIILSGEGVKTAPDSAMESDDVKDTTSGVQSKISDVM